MKLKNKQLELMLRDFEHLSKTAMMQLQIAAKLMQNNSVTDLYEEAEQNEVIMDRLEVKVREEAVFTILQFNPIAADLRRIVTYQEVTSNLERIGDIELNIIRLLRHVDFTVLRMEALKKLLVKMLGYADEMLANAIFSFSNEDSVKAYDVIRFDDKIDELFHQVAQLLSEAYAGHALEKAEVERIIQINAIAHNIEHVGDCATNIAEAAIYLSEGKDIRHGNKA